MGFIRNKRFRTKNKQPFEETAATTISKAEPFISANEFYSQYEELNITRQMLYDEKQQTKYLVNQIRTLIGKNKNNQTTTTTASTEQEKDAEAEEWEKMYFSCKNNVEDIE